MRKKKILVAALNWGLGHATRCIPIIHELQASNYEVIIGSDGAALELLKKEFPTLLHIALPSYNISYSKKGSLLKWKLLKQVPQILKAEREEYKLTQRLVQAYNLDGIISDNRPGVRSEKLKKNVYITHQINVLSGIMTKLNSYFHRRYIEKFEQCWIPDFDGPENLSGELGHSNTLSDKYIHIGPISRFKKVKLPIKYDYLILLSGPEPQRSILEKLLVRQFENTSKRLLLVRGIFEVSSKVKSTNPNIEIKNHLIGDELEYALNQTKYIICRSGYTSLMDLAVMEKKAFFIPTPGQKEQEYLAARMHHQNIAPYCRQEDFDIKKLDIIENYKGFKNLGNDILFRNLFAFFESE